MGTLQFALQLLSYDLDKCFVLPVEHGIEEMVGAVTHQPVSKSMSQAAHEAKNATAKAGTTAVAVSGTAAGRLLLSWADLSISCLSDRSVLGSLAGFCKAVLELCKSSSYFFRGLCA